jgi:hypothetical protein
MTDGHALDTLSTKRLRLRFAGTCVRCGCELPKGSWALYDQGARQVSCVRCPSPAPEPLVDEGVAGQSAHREFARRKAAREARVKGRVGNLLGGVILALTDEPQSTRAWERGATGEQKLANALETVDGLRVLHDRRVPRTRGNIDHVVIASAGVFVVDAKHYRGLIQIRDRGGLFTSDERLFVGTRDCSHLAENMAWQVEAVRAALHCPDGKFAHVPVAPVLCFVDGEWPLLFPPSAYKDVHLEGTQSITRLVTRVAVLDQPAIDAITRVLAAQLPAR